MSQGVSERAATLEAIAALLALAMHESQRPVEKLAGALTRMSRTLAESEPTGTAAQYREVFERELAVCIQGLQFHDRLMQQLAHVRNCLAAVHAGFPNAAPEDIDAYWVELRAAMRRRLSSDAQRALLDLLLPPPGTHGGTGVYRQLHASEGSIELF
jgi:hypothetical protein